MMTGGREHGPGEVEDAETDPVVNRLPTRTTLPVTFALAVVIGLLGGGLQMACLGTLPGLNGDEAYYGVLAILDDPRPEMASSDLGTWFPAVVRLAIGILGTTATAIRLGPALAAVLLPLVAFWVLSRSRGLLAGATMALPLLAHPALLVFGRIGCDYSLLPLLVGLLVLASARLFRRPDALLALLAGSIACGLAVRLHPTALMPTAAWLGCVVLATIGLARRRRNEGRRSLAAALRGPLLRLAAAVTALLIAAAPSLPFFVPFVAHGAPGVGVLAGGRAPADVAGLINGALAIEWVSGVAPFGTRLCGLLALATAMIALAGLALAAASRERAERGAALFCILHLGLGVVTLAGSDLGPPGNIRYALALFPSLLWGLGRAPDLIGGDGAPRRWLGRAARLAVLLIAAAGLWGWHGGFWVAQREHARGGEPAFVPGARGDPKAAMAERIRLMQHEAGEPPGAIVARNWDLYHASRFYLRRQLPVLRIDSHSREQFEPRFRELFHRHDPLYIVMYERRAGEQSGFVDALGSMLTQPFVADRESIVDRAGRNIISIYRLRHSR